MNNDAEAALVDAKKCVRMSNAWPKGHARKGDALMKKRLFKPALEAYERAVELDPTNAGYAEKTANAKRLDEQRRGVGGAGGGGSAGPRVVPIGKSGASAASAEGASAAAGPAASAAASAAAGPRKSALGVRLLEPSYLIYVPPLYVPPASHTPFTCRHTMCFVCLSHATRVRSSLGPMAPTGQGLPGSVWSQPAPPAPSAWPQMMCLPVVLAPGLPRRACNSCDWSPNALLARRAALSSLPSSSSFVTRFVLALLGCFVLAFLTRFALALLSIAHTGRHGEQVPVPALPPPFLPHLQPPGLHGPARVPAVLAGRIPTHDAVRLFHPPPRTHTHAALY